MSRTVSALEPATKALALGSLVLAVAGESWIGRAGWASLPTLAALAGLVGLVGGRFAAWTTSAGLLLFTYIGPVVLFHLSGRSAHEFSLIWSAAVAGLLVGDRDRWTWAYPSPWRFPLVLWALAVAVAWPITALREVDFESLALLQPYNLPNTGSGGAPGMVIMLGMDAAITHLLGLLWFSWLLRHATELTDGEFELRIAWPLAAGAIAGALLAVYQGAFDLAFLSVGSWALLRRAAGSLLDANPSGMVAAMWSAGLLALMPRWRGGRAVALGGAVVCWGGLWASGSRTALASACIALAAVGLSVFRQTGQAGLPRRRLVAGAVAVVVIAALLPLPTSDSPLRRLAKTLPSGLSRAELAGFAREMWNRDGYGEAATVLIGQRPVAGVGIGLFNLTAADYLGSIEHPWLPDNAQNWWRHHIAELGFLGASGLLLWTVVFLVFLARTSGAGPRRAPAAVVKGVLVGIGLTSLVGMPAQNFAVAMTFWAFAFWYTRLAAPAPGAPTGGSLRAWQWTVLLGVVGTYAVVMLVLARGEERPAMRAAMGKWRYTYGVYDPGVPPEAGQILRWTERHGVTVVSNDAPWMILTVRAQHPDLLERPVKARVEVNGRVVVDRTLHTDAPITRVINTGSADRAIIETRVDRTWRPPDVSARNPDVGLSLSWRFSTAKPAAPAAVTAMLTGQVEDAPRRALTVKSVTVSPAGPVVAGTPVEWTATARGGTAPLQYQFWLSDGSTWTLLQDWGANANAPWTPTAAGSYSVQVWVHSAGSPAAWEALGNSATLVVTPDPRLVITGVKFSPSCPVTPGTPVTLTTSATGGTAPLQYKIWVRNETAATWKALQEYAPTAAVEWTPTTSGPYSVQAWVRSAGSTAAWEAFLNSAPCMVTNSILNVTSVTAVPGSPAAVGTPVTWTATSSGGDPPLYYRFLLRNEALGTWTVLQDYATRNSVRWTPRSAGTYVVQVWARSARSTVAWEAWRNSDAYVVHPVTTGTATR